MNMGSFRRTEPTLPSPKCIFDPGGVITDFGAGNEEIPAPVRPAIPELRESGGQPS